VVGGVSLVRVCWGHCVVWGRAERGGGGVARSAWLGEGVGFVLYNYEMMVFGVMWLCRRMLRRDVFGYGWAATV